MKEYEREEKSVETPRMCGAFYDTSNLYHSLWM